MQSIRSSSLAEIARYRVVTHPSSRAQGPFVHLVDCDGSARDETARVLSDAGHAVRTYSSAADFLAHLPAAQLGCVLLPFSLPDGDGLDLQAELTPLADLPIIFITAQADVPQTVRAIKAGAHDVLLKPVVDSVLLGAVAAALASNARRRATQAQFEGLRRRFAQLTPREREVFSHLIAGQLNKQVAHDLGTAERTIKAHRHAIMEKLQVTSIADLVRVAAHLEITPRTGR